jgi:hypothetical protein
MKTSRARSLWFAFTIGLQGFAAFFVFAAAYAFIRGLWGLLLFLGGILFYGSVTLELDSFPERLGRALFDLIGPAVFGAVAGLCWVAAKRLRARVALASQADDPRAPVIYLRSFHADRRLARRPLAIGRAVSFRTEEEQLVEALREIGPVVAIGRPGERLPRLGAQRVYVEDADWRQQILSWFTRAALVIIHIPSKPTEGLTWEVEQGLNVVALDRLVFLVSRNRALLDWLNQKLQDRGLAAGQLKKLRRAPYRSRIGGIVHFVDGKPELRPLVKPPFLHRPFSSPLVPVYRSALEPVTRRITGAWQPLAPAFGDASVAAVWVGFCVIVIAAALHLRRTVPLEREIMICGHGLMKKLPAEARQLAENRDPALSRWMQSRIQGGLRYVPDDVVLAKATVLRRLLEIAPSADCAALAEGTIAQPALNKILNELGRHDRSMLTAWCGAQERSLVESLKSTHAEAFPISEAETTDVFSALYEDLPETERARYRRVTDNYEQSSAEDHCWFARTIFQGVERLGEPSRSTLARVGLGQDIDK